jgi:hypothetical protein
MRDMPRSAPKVDATAPPSSESLDYRPSIRLSAQQELRLLDQALEEARERPRPPKVIFTPPPPPGTHLKALRAPLAADQANGSPVHAQVNGSPGHAQINGFDHSDRQRAALETVIALTEMAVARRHGEGDAGQSASDTGRADARQGRSESDTGQADDRRQTRSETLWTDEVVVDRKRLLAAIICILQEELTKPK